MRESPLDKFRRLKLHGVAGEKAIESLGDLLATILGGTPLPTQLKFITEPAREQAKTGRLVQVKGYMGPLGCAKTATLCAFALFRALTIPGSRILISRLTYGELETTTQERFLEQVRRLPQGLILDYNRTPPATLTLKPLPDGWTEPSTIIFHSLDDVQKLASLELTDAFIDEANEISTETVHKIETRCGRRGKAPFFLGMAFNPTSDAHWLYQESQHGSPPYVKLYRPKPLENQLNLPTGYYESLTQTLPPDMRRRLIEGEWGSDFAGKPVYPEFRDGFHVSESLNYNPGEPVFWFMDFGYNNPCCLIAQRSHQGHIKVLYEIDGQREEIEPFVEHCKTAGAQIGVRFPDPEGCGDAVYGDPSAYQHRDTGQTSSRLAKMGVILIGRPTRIDDGLALVRLALSRVVDGCPGIQVHPRCKRLVAALRGGYRYRPHTDEQQPRLVPFKDDYYDHCCDALRYGILNLNLGDYRAIMRQKNVLPEFEGFDDGPPKDEQLNYLG